jgi:anti-sigma regulatory factor (Ser/Thr protein kinase)
METSTISIPADAESASIVRQFVRLACHRYGCDPLLDNVLLVTDELVANAFEPDTAAEPGVDNPTIEVGIEPIQHGVRVEVHDPKHARPWLVLPDDDSDGQRGLRVVESLASSWGVTDEPDGKTMWAEVVEATPMPAPRRTRSELGAG